MAAWRSPASASSILLLVIVIGVFCAQSAMGFGHRIVLGAPQARRMVFAADRCRVTVAAVSAAVDEETTQTNAIGKISDGLFGCRADFVGKSFTAIGRRDEWAVGPARRN